MTGSALRCAQWPRNYYGLCESGDPSRHLSRPVAQGRLPDLPRYYAPTFTLMRVGSTSPCSVHVSGFAFLACSPHSAASIRFLFVAPALCFRLPSDSRSPEKPLPSANTCPCRLCRGLSPPSRSALPGAPKERAARSPRGPYFSNPQIRTFARIRQTTAVRECHRSTHRCWRSPHCSGRKSAAAYPTS